MVEPKDETLPVEAEGVEDESLQLSLEDLAIDLAEKCEAFGAESIELTMEFPEDHWLSDFAVSFKVASRYEYEEEESDEEEG